MNNHASPLPFISWQPSSSKYFNTKAPESKQALTRIRLKEDISEALLWIKVEADAVTAGDKDELGAKASTYFPWEDLLVDTERVEATGNTSSCHVCQFYTLSKTNGSVLNDTCEGKVQVW